ncbi:hypothetical protein ABKN59_008055 [Abortiporus biennis]
MVRSHVKQTPEEKQETHKKKSTAKKKAPEPGSWPCKISGCSKVFAREADLKRHQRTTKFHSMPGFACPQCDANFTRTDALRRHQKSRHNGIIIEPQDATRARGGDAASAGSNSRSPSPSRTSGGDGADKPAPPSSNTHTQAGPSSYYRQHTMHQGYVPPPSPHMMMEYPPPIGIPTSATRFQPAWHPPPPGAWGPPPDGSPMPPPVYIPPYYQPSPYYRYPAGIYPPPMPPPEAMMPYPYHHYPYGAHMPPPPPPTQAPPSESRASTDSPKSNENSTKSSPQDGQDGTETGSQSTPSSAIDPSLSSTTTSEKKSHNEMTEQSQSDAQAEKMALEAAKAAVQAILEFKARESQAQEAQLRNENNSQKFSEFQRGDRSNLDIPLSAQTSEVPPRAQSANVEGNIGDASDDAEGRTDGEVVLEENSKSSLPVTPAQDHTEAHQEDLTEDGEPMLNASELLTQESLASPPA